MQSQLLNGGEIMNIITKMISNLEFFKIVIAHLKDENNPHNITKEQLGLTSILEWKGSVATFAGLPTNPQQGWVYSVEQSSVEYPSGMNFVWNGEKWDDLGGVLSNYITTDNMITEAEIDSITEGGE